MIDSQRIMLSSIHFLQMVVKSEMSVHICLGIIIHLKAVKGGFSLEVVIINPICLQQSLKGGNGTRKKALSDKLIVSFHHSAERKSEWRGGGGGEKVREHFKKGIACVTFG